MGTLLEVNNLKKYFKTPKGMLHAVDDVSFKIERAKTLGVVGESGCGKSTLGRTIIHLLDSTSGQIIFDGEDITHVNRRQLKVVHQRMQMIFQDPFASLDPRMSVSQIIGEAFDIYKLAASKAEKQKKVDELMEVVGLSPYLANSYPHELDGGRRQRIGIARALVLEPDFIVCDEPVSALDVSIQAQILNLMQDLQEQRGLTYLFITHDLSVVKHISDAILVMYLGNVVEYANTEDLFQHQWHPYTKALLDAVPIPDPDRKKKRRILRGELTSPINPPAGCRFAPRCDYATDKCRSETPALRKVGFDHFAACHYARETSTQTFASDAGKEGD